MIHPLSSVSATPPLRRGVALEYLTLSWNLLGTGVAIGAAISAGSVALAGFGLDSAIEIGTSTVVIWQLQGTGAAGREFRIIRLLGISFIALAFYVTSQAVLTLILPIPPSPSALGAAWTAATGLVMLGLASGKARVGRELGNRPMLERAGGTLSEAYLAAAVFTGLVLSAIAGWWWADPVVGLVVASYGIREARRAFR